jgi:hypothetical protein
MAGSVMSTGGVAALAVKMVRGKVHGSQNESQSYSKNITERSNDHGNNDSEQDGTFNRGTGNGGDAR